MLLLRLSSNYHYVNSAATSSVLHWSSRGWGVSIRDPWAGRNSGTLKTVDNLVAGNVGGILRGGHPKEGGGYQLTDDDASIGEGGAVEGKTTIGRCENEDEE